MPLNKLENFIKNYEGRILYVNSNDLDATDSITNQGNSLTKPFKTIQRALIEAARFSFVTGNDNDKNDRTTILVFPGEHIIDNRPGYGIRATGTATAEVESPSGQITAPASDELTLTLESNFDLTQEDNVLYKFNSVYGGVTLPRGTSLVGLDLRKTKIRPKYVPNPTDDTVPDSAVFRITGNCYFWQFSLFDANPEELVYTNNRIFTEGSGNLSLPTFSHHKLTCFEYADGVNIPTGYDITDLDMYYAKLSHAFNEGSGRQIPASQKFPLASQAFAKERPEWEIVGAFATDPVNIASIISGDGATPNQIVTVTTTEEHNLTAGTPIKIRGVNTNDYNVSTVVQSVSSPTTFTYLLPFVRNDLDASPSGSATVTIETDTVKGASPYIFNTSLRSVWGMNGMKADGSKASGFKSMVVAQFTAVSLQKDDRAFVKYDNVTRSYSGIPITATTGTLLSSQSSSTSTETVYHLDPRAIYRPGWEPTHIKVINDSFIQVVSVFAIGFNKHFDAQSGGDASITNSNSNFGQFSLSADGFKKEAFAKDDNAYVTSIITPKYIPSTERNIDWVSIDVGLTTAVGVSSHLYLFGFNTEDNAPPNLLQGYRVGAKVNDLMYLTLPDATTKTAKILMTDNVVSTSSTLAQGTSSAYKEYTVSSTTSAPNYDTLTLSSTHTIQTGTKILILSDDGDLPENITENKIYYAIRQGVTTLKVASSVTNAQNGVAIQMYGGTNLRVLTRLSDVNAGELGSPIQWDPNHSNWFVFTETNNDIYTSISSLGIAGFDNEQRTDVTFLKRIEDSRSLDEKIYKVRIVVPKESVNAKDPQDGFVIQESSTTGPINDAEFTLSNITAQNYNYKRNPRFISTCSESSGTVTVVTELPHNLTTGDRVLIKNVTSSTNLTGVGVTGYNGDFAITVNDNKTFTYSTTDVNGTVHTVGIFSGFNARNTELPRFERNDLKSNFYIYRAETLSPYIYNVQDGIYHAYILKADNSIPDTFTDYKYSQSIVDLYPQKDPDNINDNPTAAKTFAKRAPLGEVVTSDLKRSVTRETVDEFVTKFGLVSEITGSSSISGGVSTVTTSKKHGLNGIVGYTTLTSGTGYSIGTHYNVRLLNQSSTWDGASADLIVSGAGSSITSLTIVDGGAGYGTTTLVVEGFSGSTVAITTNTISRAEGNSLQITGLGTVTDGLYRIVSVPSSTQVAIAKTSGDPSISSGQYIFNVAPTAIVTNVGYTTVSGISTVSCISAHGLVSGNKFKIVDSSNNSIGDFVVSDTIGIHTFTFRSTINPTSAHRVLKHGFAANDLISEAGTENLGARGISFYGNESAVLLEDIGIDSVVGFSTFQISASNAGVSTTARFPLGSYIQINNEIMRIASSTLSGSGNNEVSVLRGVLGTQKSSHLQNSLIKKIKPLAVEFRRPSIVRASGHTFEYLGFGPGNYSTGLPQIQARTLTEREDFLSQSQEKSCGSVVYTGMNSDGDFFIGNTKYSSASGEQTTFDIPIPTITGQDPSRLSAVFDEIIVKERILVEGGKSKQILSQFDGPVTFNENVIINDEFKLNGDLITTGLIIQKNTQESGSPTTGSITTKGGLGVSKSLNIGGNLNIAGVTTFQSEVAFNSGLVPDSFEDAYIGRAELPWASAWIAGIGIATEGVPGGTEPEDRTINAWTGDLLLTSQVGIVSVRDNFEVSDDLLVRGNTYLTGIATVATGLVPDTDEGAYLGSTSLPFSEAHIGELRIGVTDDNTIDTVTGGIVLNSAANQVAIQDQLTVSGIGTFDSLVDMNGGAQIDNVHIGITNNNTIDTASGALTLDSAANSVIVDSNLYVAGVSTFVGESRFDTGIVPDTNEGAYIGSTTVPFSEAHIGELQFAVGTSGDSDNTITTASGNLFLDSNGGTTKVDDNLWVTSTLRVDSTSSFRENVTVEGSSKSILLKDSVGGTTRLTLSSSDGSINSNSKFQVTGSTGNTTIAGILQITNTTDSSSSTDNNASFNTDGGGAIAKKLYVGDTLTVSAGGLVVAGGFTVAGGLTVSDGGITVNAGGITASGQTITATTFNGNATTATTATNVVGGANRVLYNNSSNTTTTSSNLTFDGTNLSVGGDITAFASDIRLKNNVLPIEDALSKTLRLNGFTYTFNEIGSSLGFDSSIRHSGVSAQEIQSVLPEAVCPAPVDNNYLTVKYEKIVPLLIEAIKELNSKVEKLEQKLSDK